MSSSDSLHSLGSDCVTLADESARRCAKKLPDGDGTWPLESIHLATCLARYGKWRYAESPDALALYRQMIGFPDWRALLAVQKDRSEAIAILELIRHVLSPTQSATDAQLWLASFVLLVNAGQVDDAFNDVFRSILLKIEVGPFGAVLAATVETLPSKVSVGLLQAMQQLLTLNVEGGGKVVVQQLPLLLQAIKGIVVNASSTAILKASLKVLLTVVDEKVRPHG